MPQTRNQAFKPGRSVKEICGKLRIIWWREALPGKTWDRIQSAIKLWKINVSDDVNGFVRLRIMQERKREGREQNPK